jgi:hypothetical protein
MGQAILCPRVQAVPPYLERECAVAAFLCDRSDCVPRVIAVDRKKRWMLQRGFHGSSVEDCDDLRVWISALESYARPGPSRLIREPGLRPALR